MRCWAASSTIRAACAWMRKSMPTDNAPKRLSAIVEKACTMSASLRTSNSSAVSRSCDATALVASQCGGATGLPRLFRNATAETDGKASLSNSIRLPDSSVTNALRPVTTVLAQLLLEGGHPRSPRFGRRRAQKAECSSLASWPGSLSRNASARPTQRSFRLVLGSHDGRALAPIPERSTSPRGTSTLQRWIV